MRYIAHMREDGAEQELITHLKKTAELASGYANQFNNSRYAYISGLLHDLGKYSDEFQKRIKDNGKRCDHSTAGARIAKNRFKFGKLLSYCITGHHGGLLNHGLHSDMPREGTLCSRLIDNHQIPSFEAYISELSDDEIMLNTAPNLSYYKDQKDLGIIYYMFVKMLHSCLTDADYIDTEEFMSDGQVERDITYDFSAMLKELNGKLDAFKNSEGLINEKRRDILKQCIEIAQLSRGLFTLAVPTGGGKTLSSMAFALNHLLANGMRRIIYVIPYTSIIEQNAKVFTDIFGSEVILEHHSNYDFSSHEDDYNDVKKLATQNWDMPIIVTTNVQFFESLFSNKPSKVRKLHNIANSVIIFDEVQMLPLEYIKACTKAIAELVHNYKCTAVLCSATQPAIDDLFPSEVKPVSICEDTKELRDVFKRTRIIDRCLMATEELAAEMNSLHQCLTIVNTRKHAKKLFAMLKGEGVYHLSTLMCPKHRAEIIDEIRTRLSNNQKCKVVSTRLIEAGVDVDFPRVYRAYSGLDSIIQSAGRANREGKLKDDKGNLINGEVHIFKTDEQFAGKQPANFKLPIETTNEVIRNHEDIMSPEAVEDYFKKLYFYNGEDALDSKHIVNRINQGMPLKFKSAEELFNYPFEDISSDFKMIEENTKSIIIPYNLDAQKLIDDLKFTEFYKNILRSLQSYTINLYETEYNKLFAAGKLEFIHQDIAVLRSMADYSNATGIDIEIETGIGVFA